MTHYGIWSHLDFHYRNSVLQRPIFGYKSKITLTEQEQIKADNMLKDIRQFGITMLPGFLDANLVQEFRQVAEKIISEKDKKYGYAFSEKNSIHNIMQPLLTPGIAKTALSPLLQNVSERYFQRPTRMTEADYRLVLAMNMDELSKLNKKFAAGESTSHWHYDPRGKMLKIQIYLTDVDEGGQNFSYIKGSHKGYRKLSNLESRYSDEQVAKKYDSNNITEYPGKAGDACFFDPNGIHRVRRSNKEERESVTFYYTPGKMLREKHMHVSDKVYKSLTEKERHYLNIKEKITPSQYQMPDDLKRDDNIINNEN